MAKLDTMTINRLVGETLSGSPLSEKFKAFDIDDKPDFTGAEFVRIFLVAKEKAGLTDEQLKTVQSNIRDALEEDDRFAVVLFPGLD